MASQLQTVVRHLHRVLNRQPNGGLTDAELLERYVSRRDEAAFEALVWRHGPMVLGLCRRLLRNEQDAEDAFQAVFLALARGAKGIARREAVAGWLHGVAWRVAVRARARASRYSAKVLTEVPAAGDHAQDVAWRDCRPILDEEIGRLPDKLRAPFILCYLDGKTTVEAARELDCPKGTVLTRLASARQRLRSRLIRRGLGLSAGLVAASLANRAAAAVHRELALGTSRAALVFAEGKTALAGLVTSPVITLTQGALRAMFLTKLKTAATILLAVGLAVAGAAYSVCIRLGSGLPAAAPQDHQPGSPTAAQPAAKSTALDLEGGCHCIAWSPDGKLIATVTVTYEPPEEREVEVDGQKKKVKVFVDNSTVKIWDAEKKELKHNFGEEKKTRISHLAFSPDNKTLAVSVTEFGKADDEVRLADVEKGNANLHTIRFKAHFGLSGMAFSPDGKTLAIGGREIDGGNHASVIKLWDMRNGRERQELRRTKAEFGWPLSIALSASGKLMATAESDNTVKLWEMETGKLHKTLEGHSDSVFAVAFSRNGKLLASANTEGSVIIWELESGRSLRTLTTGKISSPISFSPDGKAVVVATSVKKDDKLVGNVKFWDAMTGELQRTFTYPGMGVVVALAFSPDGRTLATGASRWKDGKSTGELRLWTLQR